ncbi:MAG: hypothetical protein JXR96_11640 [Deltaproteobacteria bacterium]|nr:hypothetical protein [Deltaproteobacteria bacterium]
MRTRILAFPICSAAVLGIVLGAMAVQAGPNDAAVKDPKGASAPKAELDPRALAELGLEHSRSRDALLAAEARLSLLAEKLFDSKLIVRYEGEIDTPFRLSRIELYLDGTLAYTKDFQQAATVQSVKLFEDFLPPGRHLLQLRIHARGPSDSADEPPAYFSGAGLAVLVREGSVTRAVFEAEQDGEPPEAREDEPEGSWDVEIRAAFETVSK